MEIELVGVIRSNFGSKFVIQLDKQNKKILEEYTDMKMSNYILVHTDIKVKKYLDKEVIVTIQKRQKVICYEGEISVDFIYSLESIKRA